MNDESFRPHSSHWGTFFGRMTGEELEIRPFDRDPDPSDLLLNIPAAISHPARLGSPLVRRGWLKDGPGPDSRRGSDDYVELAWDEALDLAANELKRLGAAPNLSDGGDVPGAHVFGGSYGWSSAGRFHHAQSQVHRFLNTVFGGYVASRESYSSGAGAVILDLVWGNAKLMGREQAYWDEIAEDTELLIAFGGLPVRNLAASPGGNSQHIAESKLKQAAERGCEFISISPLADDFTDIANLTRLAPRPSTDTAMMLGMAFHLHATGCVDQDYLDRFTSGYGRFEDYLLGRSDGTPKTPEWAAEICRVPEESIRAIAERAARKRTHITISYGLQRSRHGEQPIWMALALASMLGQAGLPGGGFTYALGSIGNVGKAPIAVPLPSLPQGKNRVDDYIPVARIAELLLKPGESYLYRGNTRRYADIRLVYWAGGNPFHHHQDLRKLSEAFSRPETIIVHDSVGTATARHADIVFPATTTLERDDIGAGGNDPFLVPMPALSPPLSGARDDYDIFTALASRLGCETAFTDGLKSGDWLRRLYDTTRAALFEKQVTAPDFDQFMSGGIIELPVSQELSAFQRFHLDPVTHPLRTPSGRIELWSEAIARAGLPGHPAWIEPEEWLGAPLAEMHRFQLVANQPKGRLHSQLDFGATSMAGKRQGREVVRVNADDAKIIGVVDGDVVRIWNDRGGLLASVQPSHSVPRSVIQLSTGAWYAPIQLKDVGLTCVNGNPNAVTSDIGASDLSQGCAGQLSLVSLEKWTREVPAVVAHEAILPRGTTV